MRILHFDQLEKTLPSTAALPAGASGNSKSRPSERHRPPSAALQPCFEDTRLRQGTPPQGAVFNCLEQRKWDLFDARSRTRLVTRPSTLRFWLGLSNALLQGRTRHCTTASLCLDGAGVQSRLWGSLEDNISRLHAFEKTGADVLSAPGLPDLATVRAVCAAVSKPVNFMVGIKGKSFSVSELAAAGVKRISLVTSIYRAAMTGFLDAADEVRTNFSASDILANDTGVRTSA